MGGLKSRREIMEEKLKKMNEGETPSKEDLEKKINDEIKACLDIAQQEASKGNMQEAKKVVLEKIAVHPEHWGLLDAMQQILFEEKNYEESIAFGEKLRKKKLMTPLNVRTLYASYLYEGKEDEAQFFLPQGKDNDHLFVTISDFFRNRKEFKFALDTLKRVTDKTQHGYLFFRGDILRNMNRWKEANKMFNETRKLQPETSLPYKGLGLSAYDQEKYRKAAKYLRKAIDLGDEQKEELYSPLIKSLHKSRKKKELARAGDEFINLLRKQGTITTNAYGLEYLAHFYVEEKNEKKAIEAIVFRTQQDKSNDYILSLVQRLCEQKKDWSNYIGIIRERLKKIPVERSGHFVVDAAAAHWRLGEYNLAFDALQTLKIELSHSKEKEKINEILTTVNLVQEYIYNSKHWSKPVRLALFFGMSLLSIIYNGYNILKAKLTNERLSLGREQEALLLGQSFTPEEDTAFREWSNKFRNFMRYESEHTIKQTMKIYTQQLVIGLKQIINNDEEPFMLKCEREHFLMHYKDLKHFNLFFKYAQVCLLNPLIEESWNKEIKQIFDKLGIDEQTVNLVQSPEHKEQVVPFIPNEKISEPLEVLVISKRSKKNDPESFARIDLEAHRGLLLNETGSNLSPGVIMHSTYKEQKYLVSRMISGDTLGSLVGKVDDQTLITDIKEVLDEYFFFVLAGARVINNPPTKRIADIIEKSQLQRVDYYDEISRKFLSRMRIEENSSTEKIKDYFLENYKKFTEILDFRSRWLLHGDLNLNNIIKTSDGRKKIVDPAKMAIGSTSYDIMPLLCDQRLYKVAHLGPLFPFETALYFQSKFISLNRINIPYEEVTLTAEEYYKSIKLNPKTFSKDNFLIETNSAFAHRHIYCIGLFKKLYESAKNDEERRYYSTGINHHWEGAYVNLKVLSGLIKEWGPYKVATENVNNGLFMLINESRVPEILEKELGVNIKMPFVVPQKPEDKNAKPN